MQLARETPAKTPVRNCSGNVLMYKSSFQMASSRKLTYTNYFMTVDLYDLMPCCTVE